MENYYTLFEVPSDADISLIRSAFRKKAKSCHPDLFQHVSVEESKRQQKKFVRLSQAYETLADPRKRQLFDRQLGKTKTKVQPPHDQNNQRSSSFSSAGGSFKQNAESSRNSQHSSPKHAEDTLEDLLNDVEEMLEQFGLNIRDPLELLVEWAQNVYQEITEAVNVTPESINKTENKNKNPPKSTRKHTEPLDNLEAELARLKQNIKVGTCSIDSTLTKNTENEIDQELRSIKNKYRL